VLNGDVPCLEHLPGCLLKRVELRRLDRDGGVAVRVERCPARLHGPLIVLAGDVLAHAELGGDLGVGALLDAHGQDPRTPLLDEHPLGVRGPGHV